MPMKSVPPALCTHVAAGAVALLGMTVIMSAPALAKTAAEVIGQWDVMRDRSTKPCRITLNSERSDNGDFFVGVPVACRRAVPALAKVGRWNLDDAKLTLRDPSGRVILNLVADGDAFSGQGSDGATYRLMFVPAMGRSATSGDASDLLQTTSEASPPAVIDLATGTTVVATSQVQAKPAKVSSERMGDLAGRYAVLRDKTHDTGCMLTLDDKTRVKGGARAALAPACRDQGIVVFDPTAWQIVNGRLVLTAKAGHMTHLDKQADGSWLKDPAEGKSLSLKKL